VQCCFSAQQDETSTSCPLSGAPDPAAQRDNLNKVAPCSGPSSPLVARCARGVARTSQAGSQQRHLHSASSERSVTAPRGRFSKLEPVGAGRRMWISRREIGRLEISWTCKPCGTNSAPFTRCCSLPRKRHATGAAPLTVPRRQGSEARHGRLLANQRSRRRIQVQTLIARAAF